MSGDVCACPAPSAGGCCYREREQWCARPVMWIIRIDGKKHRMCDRHVQAEFHPADLRKTLPSRLTKLVRAVVQPRSYGGRA